MKTFLITILVTFLISNTFAQEVNDLKDKTLNFGLRHGYKYSEIFDNNQVVDDINLYAGLFVEKKISRRLGIQFEVNYSRNALLELPLLLKYNLSDKFQLYSGPQLNWSIDNDRESQLEDQQFGTELVLGVQYNVNSHWFIEGRFAYGLTDQFLFNQFGNLGQSYGSRNSFNFGLGYKF